MEESPGDGTTMAWQTTSRFGPYVLKRLLGRGGFGLVYEAFDTAKHRAVALKLLPSACSTNPVFRQRLFREASTAGRLTDPHVVPIHDFGEIGGQLYIDMRLVRGTDLRTVLDEQGALKPARAVSIISQIASALDAAHAERIVHRDVKPANILLTAEDFACLADFGLANAASDAKLTTTGSTVGTFAYLAPERLEGEPTDHRADIYALACVLYECLTGVPPYRATELAALITAHLTAPVPRPSHVRADIPAGFDELIATGMAKAREDRYDSAGELAAAARRVLTATPQPDPGSTIQASTAVVPRTRTRLWIALLGVLLLTTTSAAAFWLGHRQQGTTSSTAPASPPSGTAALTATILVGKHPEGVAVDPTTGTAYTANYADGTVSVIDTRSRTVTATIDVGRGPLGVAVDPGTQSVYTANNRDDSVSVVDAQNHVVTATIGVGTNPWAVAVDPTTQTAYVTNNWDNNVSVIALASRTVRTTIPVGKHPEWVAVDPATHTAYVTNSDDSSVSVIDTTNHTVTTTIRVGNSPLGVAADPTTHTAYVANYSDRTLSVLDTRTHTVIATIDVGANPWGVAVDPDADTVYVTNSGDGTVSVVDTRTRTVTDTVNVGDRIFAVAVDPTAPAAYITNRNDSVSVVEPIR